MWAPRRFYKLHYLDYKKAWQIVFYLRQKTWSPNEIEVIDLILKQIDREGERVRRKEEAK